MKSWMKSICENTPLLHHYTEILKDKQIYNNYRSIKDEAGRETLYIASTISNNAETDWVVGVISPVQADILGRVISEYVESAQFKADWSRIAEKHLTE